MNKKIIVSLAALLIVGASALPIEAAAVPVSQPVSMQSAVVPISKVSKTAPPPATAKPENEGTVFEGYNVTVTDKNTPAVLSGGIDWPITKLYFFSANGDYLGSISGVAYKAIMDKYKVIGEGGSVDAPGSNGDWEYWFAEKFNAYRGISGNDSSRASSDQGISVTEMDTDDYNHEVIKLTNIEREEAGLNTLETEPEMMELAQIRAEEIASQFSHVRPDGVRISELGYGENISKGRNSPKEAVNGWMDSSGHKANILHEKYKFIGVGCFIKDGTYYWVQLFSWNNSRDSSDGGNKTSETHASTTAYSLNATELTLTAEETYQMEVEASPAANNMRVEWVASKLSDGILSVDDDGYITTYHRSGMSSAKATLTVSAKIYASDKLVKTLNCKVIVTQ